MKLPVATPWAVGDLEVTVCHGRSVYALVCDTGPNNKIAEASRTALAVLRGGNGVAAIGRDSDLPGHRRPSGRATAH